MRLRPDGDRHRAKEIVSGRARRRGRRRLESISLVQNDKINRFRGADPWLVEHVPAIYMTMIETAETVADRYGISREAQDEYALRLQRRTAEAQAAGRFADEIVPITTRMSATTRRPARRRRGRSPCRRRGQPAADPAGGSRRLEAGVSRTASASRRALRALHHGRQCQPALGRRLGLRADGGPRGRRRGLTPLGAYRGMAVAGLQPRRDGHRPGLRGAQAAGAARPLGR